MLTCNKIIKAWKNIYESLSDGAEYYMIFDEGIKNYCELIKNTLEFIPQQNAEIEKLRKAKGKLEVNTSKKIQRLHAENRTLQKYLATYKEEIEKLQKENAELDDANILLTTTLQKAEAEAIKEFSELFENKINEIDFPYSTIVKKMVVVCKRVIDEVKKEILSTKR